MLVLSVKLLVNGISLAASWYGNEKRGLPASAPVGTSPSYFKKLAAFWLVLNGVLNVLVKPQFLFNRLPRLMISNERRSVCFSLPVFKYKSCVTFRSKRL